MSKRLHPIRKMIDAMQREGAAMPYSEYDIERSLARSIKPLLDALEESRSGLHAHCAGATADTIRRVERLLAAWREPLK